MKRTIVYIDGFNLYYGLLRGTFAKWLDLVTFSKALLAPDHEIIAIKYFTSRVNYNKREPKKKEHQEIYLRALTHFPLIQIIEGFYKSRDAKLPFRKEPCISCRPYADVIKTEEKRSDVNLATAMMADCHANAADSFVVISGDADFIAPIEYIRHVARKQVLVFNPHKAMSGHLKKVATYYKDIPRDLPAKCQLPTSFTYGTHNRQIHCPPEWLSETTELIDDVRAAEEEIERGETISQDEFKRKLIAERRLRSPQKENG